MVVRVGTEDSAGELLEVDTYVRPGGAVTGEHVHPAIEEWRAGTRAGWLPHRQARVDHGAGSTLARAGPRGTRLVERRRGGGVRYSRDQSRREVRGDDHQPLRPGTGRQDETRRGCSTSCRPRSSPGSSVTCCSSPSFHSLCSDCCTTHWRQSLRLWATGTATRSIAAARILRVAREPAHCLRQGGGRGIRCGGLPLPSILILAKVGAPPKRRMGPAPGELPVVRFLY